MESNNIGTPSTSEEDLRESDGPSETLLCSQDVQGTRNSTAKRQRTSDDVAQRDLTSASQSYGQCEHAIVRMILRSFTYFVYDGVSVAGGQKEVARIGKAIVELLVDEKYPPPHRSDMSIGRKCTEYLVAPAVSSLAWFIVKIVRGSQRKSVSRGQSKCAVFVWAKGLWAVIHRIARQALIYRLFFRIGSLRYTLASLLGIICCFFKDSLFPDFLRLQRWPSHFSSYQGLAAIFRSVVYAVSFSLPVQNLSKSLEESARRRGNVKKLIFAVILSQLQILTQVQKLASTSQSWTV